jgi:hypothetical protein
MAFLAVAFAALVVVVGSSLEGKMAFLAVAFAALVVVVGVPITGLVLLVRFVAAEHAGGEIDSYRTSETPLSGAAVWSHLQGWFRTKPRRLTASKQG